MNILFFSGDCWISLLDPEYGPVFNVSFAFLGALVGTKYLLLMLDQPLETFRKQFSWQQVTKSIEELKYGKQLKTTFLAYSL